MTQAKRSIYSLRFLVMALTFILAVAAVALSSDQVRSRLGSAGKVVPAVMENLLAEAARAEKDNRWPEAIGVYEQVLDKDPGFVPAYLKLGMIYFRIGLPSKAEEQYLLALQKGITDPDIYLHLGYIKESQEKLDEAANYYAKAELGGSRNPVLYFNTGNIHARQGRADKAVEYFKRAVILKPGYMDAFVNLSIISTQVGEYPDAFYYLEKAEKLGYEAPKQYKEQLEEKLKK